MLKIDRYLLKQLFITFAVLATCLVAIIWLSRSLQFINYLVNRGVPFSLFLKLMYLLVPSLLYTILPITLFVAVILVYNRLSQDHELMVSSAAGMSPSELARPAIRLGAAVTVFAYFLSLYLIPTFYREFKDLQVRVRNDFSSALLEIGAFSQISQTLTIFVRDRAGNGELSGILVHDTSRPEKPATIVAERGGLVDTSAGPRILVVKGNRQEYDRASGRLNILYFDEYTLDLNPQGAAIENRWREPRERYLSQLFIPQDNDNDLRYRNRLVAEGHNRLTGPLYNLGFVTLGLYVLIMGEFSRQGHSRRVFISVLFMIAWLALSLAMHGLTARQAYFAPLMYLCALLPTAGFVYLLEKSTRFTTMVRSRVRKKR